MRISVLARRSGVPLPTIRYYLRAGLLPAGTATAANQAEYGDRHLHRLRLLFVLLDVGGMSVAGARAVLRAIEDGGVPLRDLLALVAGAGATGTLRGLGRAEHDAMQDQLGGVLAAQGISGGPGSRPMDRLIDAYASARRLGLTELETALDRYAGAAARLVECDAAVTRTIAGRAGAQPAEVREAVVVVAVLARVIQEAVCDLARQQWLPEAVPEAP